LTKVANFGGENYKYGFTTDIDADKAPNGLNGRYRPVYFRQKRRAGMVVGMAVGCV
jgi:hypothetical protein